MYTEIQRLTRELQGCGQELHACRGEAASRKWWAPWR
jgi:hypothetical protein